MKFDEVMFNMGKTEEPMSNITDWLFSVALKKVIKRLVVVVLAYLATPGVSNLLTTWGVSVDTRVFENTVMSSLWFLFEFVRNFIKTKTGLSWL